MKLNWKYLESKTKLIFAACKGEKLFKEFSDMSIAIAFEKNGSHEFKNSIDEFLKEQKQHAEARMSGKYFERKIDRIPSTEFRRLQKQIEKKENEK